MSHGVLEVALIPQLVGTYLYSIFGIEPSCLPCDASSATDIAAMDIAAKLVDVFPHEADDGTYDRNALNNDRESRDAQ